MKKVFEAESLYSLIDGKHRDNYHRDTATQNRWDENCAHRTGVVEIGEDISEFIETHDIIKLKIRFHRRDSFHGINAKVKPDLRDFNFKSEAKRGEWTEFEEIDKELVLKSRQLTVGTGQTRDLYAIWDKVEIEAEYV